MYFDTLACICINFNKKFYLREGVKVCRKKV